MKTYRIPLLMLGLFLLILAGVWRFALSERWSQRFPDDWKWEISILGTTRYPDEATGDYPPELTFPDDDDVNISEREITVSDDNAADGSILMSDHSTSRDVNTNAVIWEFTYTAEIDPETAKHTTEPHQEDYFLFPRNVEQKTYNIRHSSYQGLPLTFEGEEEIEGLLTYHFAFHGEMDNSAAYPDQPLEENQSIRCSELYLEYWVEPVTGEIAKYREGCASDYVFDTQTNENLIPLSRWSAESGGDDIIRQVNDIKSQRRTLLWTSIYIPLLLAVAGVLALGLSVVGFTRREVAA